MISLLGSISAEIGILGGTGIYSAEMFNDLTEIKVHTPYGETSDNVCIGRHSQKSIAFIPRHGKGHRIPPHRINYRANIWALKSLGVTRILAPSAVGSLNTRYKPGDFVIPDQFIDLTKQRACTFYDGGKVCHISVAQPFCPELTEIASSSLKELSFDSHSGGTYICIEGPRFSTMAESKYYREVMNAQIIGMTLIPECILAREAEICYISLSTVTDYDVWTEKPVNSKDIINILEDNVSKTKKIIAQIISHIPDGRDKCTCSHSLENSIL
ncbi:MAG: S-methyl-5'-thioadenosine phosphorylase [Nitrososphaeraceae archaeon]|jgi:5'-methylthioadenosine phosphorylase